MDIHLNMGVNGGIGNTKGHDIGQNPSMDK